MNKQLFIILTHGTIGSVGICLDDISHWVVPDLEAEPSKITLNIYFKSPNTKLVLYGPEVPEFINAIISSRLP